MTATPCPDCGAPILWLATRAGRMPVDAGPDAERGNVMATDSGRAVVLGAGRAADARRAGVELHTHHRLSCPLADRWARK